MPVLDPALEQAADPPAASILIVDDDPAVRALVRNALEQGGFVVTEAADGAEACRACEKTVPDLLIVEAMMPNMDGFKLCHALRDRAATAQVPILMATDFGNQESIARAFEVGATDFIGKPINGQILLYRVRYLLRAARAFDALLTAKEAAEAADRSKSEFLANISHELRTPLNAIIGFASIIQQRLRGPLDPRYVEDAGLIAESGTHLLEIINDILDIAKAEANTLELYEDAVNIPEIVEFSAKMVVKMAQTRTVDVSYTVEEGLPALWGDGKKLRQILINLLSNAIKFTKPNGHVSLTAAREPSGDLIIRVADNGIGIPADKIAVALAPFGQVDATLARNYDGVGLGLPLAKRLVELHGGSLWIESEPGTGTEVTVRLPRARLADRAPSDGVQPGEFHAAE